LAVLIVGVFTAIAVARSPRHHLRHGRAFPGEQKPVLIFEALQAAWRYVIFAWRRGLVPVRFSCKPFSHILVLPARIHWVHKALRMWICDACSYVVVSSVVLDAFSRPSVRTTIARICFLWVARCSAAVRIG